MARNYYSEINLHFTWHTKNSSPLLIPKIEAVVFHSVRGRCINEPGVFIHEIGATENHVHVCMSIPPTLIISEFIGKLKGGSSFDANHKLGAGSKLLDWQTGYGVVSFGTKDLEWVKGYVRDQKKRHARGDFVERLERINAVESTELQDGEAAKAEQREAP